MANLIIERALSAEMMSTERRVLEELVQIMISKGVARQRINIGHRLYAADMENASRVICVDDKPRYRVRLKFRMGEMGMDCDTEVESI